MRPLLRSIQIIIKPKASRIPPPPPSVSACLPIRPLQRPPSSIQCQLHVQRRWLSHSARLTAESNPSRPEPKPNEPDAPNNPPSNESAIPSSSPPTDPQVELKNLPSQQESRRSDVSKKFSTAMDDLQTVLFNAGQKLNDVTGYSGIEALKKSIEQQEEHVKQSRLEVRRAKEDYQAAINRRSASQREVNELLQRKHAWSAADLERFTELYRSDHANEQAEAAAQFRLTHAERVADESQAQLARSILARYHEEQIWSDKIRRASTWGTWGLMGFNVLLFIVVQLGLEPWKRKRLVGGFEEKVREVIQEESMRNAILHIHPAEESKAEEAVEMITEAPRLAEEAVAAEALAAGQEETVGNVEATAAAVVPEEGSSAAGEAESAVEEAPGPAAVGEKARLEELGRKWSFVGKARAQVGALFSERQIVISQVEFTTAILQSASAGAALAVVISLALRYR